MPMLEKYRHYFNIDPDYFPAVNEAVITKNPEVWKKFFPHETFVKLLKNTVSVLERKQKLCLWVEGAYGTGKSHAVHTLKKLLDSSEEETREYFQRHKMDNDLYNRFQAVKSSGRILTVHRYGSASIRSDHNLVFAIQESIEKALVDAGIENKGGNALKDATIAWLSDKDISTYKQKASNKKWLWLYFIGLKLFHAGNNSYFNKAIETATSPSGLIHSLYRTILEEDPTDKDFISQYRQRKDLLNSIENPLDEVSGFCKIVQSKGKYALCYLTDNTLQEKELIFKLLDRYSEDFGRAELLDILERIYPDLRAYLTAYHFKSELLDNYFQEYKYQKVVNKIFPDFMTLVEKQAVDRDYNRILPPRSSVIEGIDVTDTQTYFTDAMGVEYLGYIMSRCHALKLMAKVTVCRCELPSITSRNKEFWDVLSTDRFPIISVDKIDKIKHHGEEGYDYSREDRKLPIHLIRELELIDELLKKIKTNLTNGDYQKAILIADHGASRLAVIHGTENLWEMQSSGKHSGRCCPKSEVDERPDSATDAEDFWALANYDRFKGSRKANVEVHGGATLEEVTVPIIEISYLNDAVEVKIMPIDSTATFTGIPEIFVSFRKKAAIKVFSTEKLVDVSVVIDGHTYEAKPTADNFYVVEEMTEIRRAKTYSVDVFAGGMPVATGLPLRVKKESGSEKNIL